MKILNLYKDWRNKRAVLKDKAALTSIYLDSVGKRIYSGDGKLNKEKHGFLWNKGVRPRTQYEMMQRTVRD